MSFVVTSAHAAHPSRSVLPAGVRSSLVSAGAELVDDERARAVDVRLHGRRLARVTRSPRSLVWDDPTLARCIELLVGAHRDVLAIAMHGDRSLPSPESPEVEPLLAAARTAGVQVARRSIPEGTEHGLTHPLLGEVARLVVPRGRSDVADVSFASPELVDALSMLLERSAGPAGYSTKRTRTPSAS